MPKDQDTEGTPLNTIPSIENLPDLPINHIAYSILRENGFNNSESSKALKFTPANGTLINQKLKSKYDLTNNQFVKLASTVVKKVLKGDPTIVRNTALDKNGELVEIIKDIYPKHSEQLDASKMVYDRVQPVKRSDDPVTSISFIQINLGGYE